MVNEPEARLLLRAVVDHPGGRIVTHTLHVRRRVVTVAGGELPVGTTARIELSFPRLIEAFEVVASVIATSNDEGLGRPASTTFDVTSANERAKTLLVEIAQLNAEPPTAPGKARANLPRYRCLLVEDNPFIRDLFAWGLGRYHADRRTDLSMDHALDVEQAWSLLSESDYDLAIIDHYLPTTNGASLIARIRAEPRLSTMPVVAISVGGSEIRDESITAGADLFLDKPVVLRDLFATLDKLTPRQVKGDERTME